MYMTPEEKERYDRIDRQLEFLAAHQAQLSSDLSELHNIVARQSQQIEKHGEQIAKHDEQIAKHGEQIATVGTQVQSLADTVLRLARIVDERDRQTDAKINALIGVVERYFSNGGK
jgi:chromosome segregation ATPase